jgi:hypothetical protein
MLDKWRGVPEGKDHVDQKYHRELTIFNQQVQSVIEGIDDIVNNLSDEYPQEALSQLSRHFERISRDFASYTIATTNMFYEVIRRSKLRTKAVKAVESKARSVAKLFEKYAKRPKSYSQVVSRLEIYKLRDILVNLLTH